MSPAVGLLERREMLTGPTATMIQTATFPNLEALPNAATGAFLYFSSSMGTLTEVDVVTSGSFSTEFSAENLGSSSNVITGTTTANLSINLPSGAIPVSMPSVTETFNASPFDGNLDYGGTGGNVFAPVTNNSATGTTVLTSPGDLAAFTGNFRIPITVSGHAQGTATSTTGDMSDSFQTLTSTTITVIYHYDPSLPSLGPTTPAPAPYTSNSSGEQGSESATGTSSSDSGTPTVSSPSTVISPAAIVQTAFTGGRSMTHTRKRMHTVMVKPARKVAKRLVRDETGRNVKE
jgi:hypothetical protein